MHRRNLVGMAVIATLALLPATALGQQRSLKEQLVGAWTLVSFETTATNGTKQQPLGPNPKGVLILDASGQLATVQGRPDRPKFKPSVDFRLDTPAAEFGEAAKEFLSNFGTWSVNEEEKTLVKKHQLALIPNLDTQETKYAVSLNGDDLKLVRTFQRVETPVSTTVYRRAR